MKLEFQILENEYWWGGCVADSENMPFDRTTVFTANLQKDWRTQTAPLFLSNLGRVVWCDNNFIIGFNSGHVTVETVYPNDTVTIEQGGSTLREAYLYAMNKHFPFAENIHTPREFYRVPQFNTWTELIKNQNQTDILKYAHEIIENGYKPGILMIDGGWQQCQGVWIPRKDMMPDPKAMTDELHRLGFIVMIWVSPFVCPEGDHFLNLSTSRSSEARTGKPCLNHLTRNKKGEVSIQKWWSGFGAIHNFNLPDDRAEMAEQLRYLMDLGFDGFKFDGGSYKPQTFLNGTEFYGGYTVEQLNNAWIDFGSQYRYHEFKDSWGQGGKPVIQRLFDKNHSWDKNGINCLVPHGCFVGLIGSPFICPDMVGGGEWSCFVYGTLEEELFVRMAEASALYPMMQFSALPWRHLSPKGAAICKKMAELHESLADTIDEIITDTEKTGEPIIRSMEYNYPHKGYETVNDQFMVGKNIIVAPVIKRGETFKTVRLPSGDWRERNTDKIYHGNSVITVDAPIDILPWFTRV